MLRYKINVMEELKARGYTTYRIKTEKLLGGSRLDALRAGEIVGTQTLEILCRLLGMQPGDILEYVEEESATEQKSETEE